ncbi:MAG: flagellar hook-basal body complex protein FliE [Pseudomonas sp.]|uniref:flagellar hook-basal body complex protein FliE n=1 Tax=Pseudomonas sp. TaxID=306 RepID=UPI003394E7A1
MKSISHVQQEMLNRMELHRELSAGGAAIKPALQLDEPGQPGVMQSFTDSLHAVDAQQHQAAQAMNAVDSGRSDDLVGAMIDSQKASLSFSALLQVRNKLSSAFDDIMRMPI